ncbi:MAG: response regulator, partial [Bacteroidetes bacterium]|nr:response regulator [Bacteroidota bacterium]
METKIIKILAIDDIQDNLIILKALINESIENTIVFTAITGKIGIEIAALENPDVILLDILMPEMDGYEVCKILKADNNLKEIPVVFVTTLKGDKAIRIKALEVGAEAFLAKPIDESELIAQIKAMVKIKEANFEKLNKEKILLELVAEKTKELTESNKKSVKLLEDLLKENEARKISEQAVIESEDKYSKAFQTSPYCITITSLNDGTFVDVNESFCETTGFTKEEVIGKKVGEINVWFNLEDRKYVINSLLKNEKIEQQLAYFRKKNGEKIIAIYSAQVIHINGASHILASINDITKQKLAELNLLKLNRIQSLNSQINDLIIRIHNKMQLFEEVCEIAANYGNFRMSWISQIDEQSKVITPLVWHGHEDGYLKEIQKISIENNLYGIGPTGIAFREGKVSVCNNIATDPKMEPWRKEALKRGYLSSIALPIKVRKKVIGTFNLYSGEVDFFAQNEEVELLENITSNISFSLEKILDE